MCAHTRYANKAREHKAKDMIKAKASSSLAHITYESLLLKFS